MLKPDAVTLSKPMPAAAEAQPSPRRPAPPQAPPTAHDFVTAHVDQLNDSTGQGRMDYVESISIIVDEDGVAAAQEMQEKMGSASASYTKSTESIAGRYWRVGEFCNMPAYRQEAGASSHDLELLLVLIDGDELAQHSKLRQMKGWFIINGPVVESLLASQKSATDAELNVVAWCGAGSGADGTGYLPTLAHIPYWSKKPHRGVTIMPTITYLEDKVEQLQKQLGEKRARTEGVAAVDAGGKRPRTEGAPGGGWFNKMKFLIAELLKGNVDAAMTMADEYTNEERHPMMSREVKRQMGKRGGSWLL